MWSKQVHRKPVSCVSQIVLTTLLVYSVVKLRLPHDELIGTLTAQSENQLLDMTPKDIALVAWSLARINYPSNSTLFAALKSIIFSLCKNLNEIDDTMYEHDTMDSKSEPRAESDSEAPNAFEDEMESVFDSNSAGLEQKNVYVN